MIPSKEKSVFLFSIVVLSFIATPLIGYSISKTHSPASNVILSNELTIKEVITPSDQLLSYEKIIPVSKTSISDAKYIDKITPSTATLITGLYTDENGEYNHFYTMSQFLSDVELSDNEYAYITSVQKNLYSTHLDNYFNIPIYLDETNTNALNFAYWLGSNLDSYMIYDVLVYNTDYNTELIGEKTYSFINIDDPYFVGNSSKTTFNSVSDAEISVTVGGITLYDNQLQLLWKGIQIYQEYYNNIALQGISLSIETWFDMYYFTESEAIKLLVLAIDKSINYMSYTSTIQQLLSLSSFDAFKAYLGINTQQGYKSYSYYNPLYVSEINGYFAYKFFTPINSYTIQAYNYYVEDWVDINTVNGSLIPINQYSYYQNININTHAWQYLSNNSNSDQVQWRILINGENTSFDFYGFWTQLETSTSAIDLELYFEVENENVTKSLLQKPPEFVIEYKTINIDNEFESMYLVTPLENQTTGNLDEYLVSTLTGSIFKPSPFKDTLKSYPIGLSIVENNTGINVRLRGIYGLYSIDDLFRNITIAIDKIYIKYEYTKPIEIQKFACINSEDNTRIDWIYEVIITDQILELNVSHPLDHVFLSPDLLIIEDPNGNNIYNLWLRSTSDQMKYGDGFIRLTQDDIRLLGYGRYRFWFKSINYILKQTFNSYSGSQIINSTGDIKDENVYIDYDVETSFQTYIREINGINGFSSASCIGLLNITLTGNKMNTNTIDSLIYTGFQQSYEIENKIDPLDTLIKYNLFYYNTTFNSSVEYFNGKVSVEFIWESLDGNKIGYAIQSIQFKRFINIIPTGVFINPTYYKISDLGYNTPNFILFKSYHEDTTSVVYNITNSIGTYVYFENRTLYKYSSLQIWLIDYLNGIEHSDENVNRILSYIHNNLNDEMPTLPENEERYDDVYYVDVLTPYIENLPEDEYGASIRYIFSATIHVLSGLEGTPGYLNNYSLSCNALVNIVSRPNAYLFDVYDLNMGNYLTVNYFLYSSNIQSMTFKINGSLQNEIYTVSTFNSTSDYNWLLTQGQHSYILPFNFGIMGSYSLIVEFTDIFNNTRTLETIQFDIIDPDQRSWIIRFLDDTVEYIASWFAFFSLGIIVYKKRKESVDTYIEKLYHYREEI